MFDIGFWELALIGVIALLVLGPERLPRLARTVGLYLGRARRYMSEVKKDINAELRTEDLRAIREVKDDLRAAQKEIEKTGDDLNRDAARENKRLMDAINETAPRDEKASEPAAASAPDKSAGS